MTDIAPDPPELLCRYRWAAHAAGGGNVLDVGRGTETGAAPDLLDLPFGAGEFDAIVCFETIDEVSDPGRALDELQRVLTPDGVLLISSAIHDLPAALAARFANVATHHQQTYAASLICDSRTLAHDDPTQPIPTTTTKTSAHPPDTTLCTIATATNGTPPTPPTHHELTLGAPPDDDGLALWRDRAIEAEINLTVCETDTFWERYVGNETILIGTTRETHLKRQLANLEREREAARDALWALERSASWRLTAPLRRIKRLGRRAPG